MQGPLHLEPVKELLLPIQTDLLHNILVRWCRKWLLREVERNAFNDLFPIGVGW
jgi:hypothetical protein